MIRRTLLNILFILPLTLVVNIAWAADDVSDSWCNGYIRSALGALPVDGLNRNNLWLAWNETVNSAIIAGQLDKKDSQAGYDAFSQQLASNNVQAMIDTSDDQCDLGRNSTWVWW
ncbi:MAG: hypothetical protein ABJ308_15325 [Halieaceae bacterium]